MKRRGYITDSLLECSWDKRTDGAAGTESVPEEFYNLSYNCGT